MQNLVVTATPPILAQKKRVGCVERWKDGNVAAKLCCTSVSPKDPCRTTRLRRKDVDVDVDVDDALEGNRNTLVERERQSVMALCRIPNQVTLYYMYLSWPRDETLTHADEPLSRQQD
jgi:hypothetical protein